MNQEGRSVRDMVIPWLLLLAGCLLSAGCGKMTCAGKGWILDTKAWREQWLRFQQDLVLLSPQGKQVIATESGHFIQDQQPAIVIKAIQEMVEQARGKASTDSVRVR